MLDITQFEDHSPRSQTKRRLRKDWPVLSRPFQGLSQDSLSLFKTWMMVSHRGQTNYDGDCCKHLPPISDQTTLDFSSLMSLKDSGTKSRCASSKSSSIRRLYGTLRSFTLKDTGTQTHQCLGCHLALAHGHLVHRSCDQVLKISCRIPFGVGGERCVVQRVISAFRWHASSL